MLDAAGASCSAPPCVSNYTMWAEETTRRVLNSRHHTYPWKRRGREAFVCPDVRHAGVPCAHVPQDDDRLLLPRLMQELGYRGDSAELGVWIEDFSKLILKAWPSGRRHIGFDPYLAQPCVKHERDKHCITSQSDFDGIYSKTKSRLEGQFPAGRVSVLRNTSVEAAQLVRNGSLDFVYVDARHDYRSVKEDMGLWWSKVCRGGVLLGHDLIWPGVRRAVVEFVAKSRRTTSTRSSSRRTTSRAGSSFAARESVARGRRGQVTL